MTAKKINEILNIAKAQGRLEVTIEGSRFVLTQTPLVEAITKPQAALVEPIKLSDKELSALFKQYPDDDPINDPELMQYYATHYYDVLIAEREAKAKHATEAKNLTESTNG